MSPWILALDFGGTKLTAAVLSLRDRPAWHAFERIFCPPGADARSSIQAMFNLAHELLEGEQPAATGVSFGGPVDANTGTVQLSHHGPGWVDTPLARMIEAEFGAPSRVDNDANAAALGEHRFGAGGGLPNLMYITVSTGVGGGWILGGKPWRGAGGLAGEIGHIVVDPRGPVCACGKRGCVESLASGPSMARAAQEKLRSLGPDELEKGRLLLHLSGNEPSTITGQMLSQAAEQGDEIAREVLEYGAWALGVGIGNAANLIDPQRFILGGGVTKSGPLFWDTVRRAARATALPEVQLEVVPAELGDEAPLWGAAALAEDCI